MLKRFLHFFRVYYKNRKVSLRSIREMVEIKENRYSIKKDAKLASECEGILLT